MVKDMIVYLYDSFNIFSLDDSIFIDVFGKGNSNTNICNDIKINNANETCEFEGVVDASLTSAIEICIKSQSANNCCSVCVYNVSLLNKDNSNLITSIDKIEKMHDTVSFLEVITKLCCDLSNIQYRQYHYTETLPRWYDLTKESVSVYTSILKLCYSNIRDYKQISMNVLGLLSSNFHQFILDDLNPIKFKLWKNFNNGVLKFSCIENLLKCLNDYMDNLIGDERNKDLMDMVYNTICIGFPILYANKNERVNMIIEMYHRNEKMFYSLLKFLTNEPLHIKSLCEDFYICDCNDNILLFEKLLELAIEIYIELEKNGKTEEKVDKYNSIISFLIQYQTHFLSYCYSNSKHGNAV